MNIRAKKIKIVFDNGSEDYWEATCESGIRFNDAMSMIAKAWKEHDEPKKPLLKDYPNEMEAIRAYGVTPLTFHRHARKGYSTFNYCTHYISFSRLFENLKDGETYALADLCGVEVDDEA